MPDATEIKLDKGVPLPRPRARFVPVLHKMKPGDSFFVAANAAEPTRNRVINTCKYFARRHRPGAAFATRLVEGGIRVWRVK